MQLLFCFRAHDVAVEGDEDFGDGFVVVDVSGVGHFSLPPSLKNFSIRKS